MVWVEYINTVRLVMDRLKTTTKQSMTHERAIPENRFNSIFPKHMLKEIENVADIMMNLIYYSTEISRRGKSIE